MIECLVKRVKVTPSGHVGKQHPSFSSLFHVLFSQVSKSMSGVVKSMDATLKSMNLEKVRGCLQHMAQKLFRKFLFVNSFFGSLCFCTDLCTDGQVWKAVWDSWRADSSDGGYHEQHHHSDDTSGNTSCYLPRRKHSWALVAAYACRIAAFLFSHFISKGRFLITICLLGP